MKRWKLEKLPLKFCDKPLPDIVIKWSKQGNTIEVTEWIKPSKNEVRNGR